MVSRVVLTVDWGKCDSGDIKIEDEDDLISYMSSTLESNALFDHVELEVRDAVIAMGDDLK